jgi:hypothetical protein
MQKGWEMNREKGCPGRNREEAQKPSPICSARRCADGKLEEDLRDETVKWQKKAQDLYEKVSGEGEFLEKGDLIRAFEAVIWAWAWMEIGLQKGLLRQRE